MSNQFEQLLDRTKELLDEYEYDDRRAEQFLKDVRRNLQGIVERDSDKRISLQNAVDSATQKTYPAGRLDAMPDDVRDLFDELENQLQNVKEQDN